jgi:hypothetical protein
MPTRIRFSDPSRTCRIYCYIELIEHGTCFPFLVQAVETGPLADHQHIAFAEAL